MSEKTQARILDEAAQWLALLDSGHATAQDEQAFAQWQAQDPRHARSIQAFRGRLNDLQGSALGNMAHGDLLQTISTPSSRRAFIRKGAGLLGIGATALLIARVNPGDLFNHGDLLSGTGQRSQMQLPDGSQLLLNARSRVTPDFDNDRRHLSLHEGELQLSVAPGRTTPMRIETPAGIVSSLDSLLQVRREGELTRLLVLSSSAHVLTQDGQQRLVKTGQGAWFDGQGQLEVRRADQDALLWVKGLMKIHDQPLGDLVAALRTYRPGIIRVSPQAARIRVSGIYSLDDTQKTLFALRDSLRLKIDFYTDYWVNISLGERRA